MSQVKYTARKTVKDILLEHKLVKPEDLAKAEEEAKKTERPLHQVVSSLKLADPLAILQVISKEWRTKAVDLSQIEIDPEVVKIIPESTSRRHLALPFAKEGSALMVAMSDPRDFFIAEDIHLRTGFEVQGYMAFGDDIIKELNKVYGVTNNIKTEELVKGIADAAEDQINLEKIEEKVDVTDIDASAPEVEKLCNAIIIGALQISASDIHIEPFEGKMIVRYRVDGILREAPFQVPWTYRNAVIARIKIMTNQMDITERRKPQDGRIQVMAKLNPVEFRVNIVPTVFGESCCMRVLDRASVRVDIGKLGFLPDTLQKFNEVLKRPYGLILVCGPTGSGKSTTLYSALNSINEPDVKILTAENPVEYNLPGIVQVNINQEIQFDFAMAMRAFLRQDPDIIMVGEIRDKETAQIAMEAAMTGHLVFSTIHTNDAPSAVARLHEMGVPSFLVASTIEAVLAQRLIRTACPNCKKPLEIIAETRQLFEKNKIPLDGATLMKGEGCNTCNKTGYKGRVGVHELLVMDADIRKLLLSEVAAGPIRELAIQRGMRPLLLDGLIKVTKGLTTIEEVMTVA